MNELSRHIEILLLDNDCVIVPGFGGFMAHHSPAMYLDDAATFYPPQRTLGFNPQLQLNDSLLAQSYVEAYDISYPEAVRMIEGEVEEIRQTLSIQGSYEFHGIGQITSLADGRYDFQPCLAGLLTPSLYALDSLQMDVVQEVKTEKAVDVIPEEQEEKPATLVIDTIQEPYSYTMVRNILAAAMLALFIVFSCIPLGIGSNLQKCSMISTELLSSIITKAPKAPKTEKSASATFAKETGVTVRSDAENALQTEKPQNESFYTIVLASRVSKKGAEQFVAHLKDNGMKDASVFERHSTRKVIYGKFSTEKDAYNALAKLRKENNDFTQAWTTQIKL